MINDILYGIAKNVKKQFGYAIYINKVEQDFTTPSFYIKCIDYTTERLLTNDRKPYHNKSNLSFSIVYFPNEELENPTEDINKVIIDLFYCLDLVKAGKYSARLINCKTETIDNTLTAVANYKINTYLVTKDTSEIEIMGRLNKNIEI